MYIGLFKQKKTASIPEGWGLNDFQAVRDQWKIDTWKMVEKHGHRIIHSGTETVKL